MGSLCAKNNVFNANYVIYCKHCDSELMHAMDQIDAEADSREEGDTNETSKPCRHIYVGESCRGCITRFQQHISKLKAQSGIMYEHLTVVHNVAPNEDPYACKDSFA